MIQFTCCRAFLRQAGTRAWTKVASVQIWWRVSRISRFFRRCRAKPTEEQRAAAPIGLGLRRCECTLSSPNSISLRSKIATEIVIQSFGIQRLVFRIRCVFFRIPSCFRWPDRICQLNPPNGSTEKKGALRLDESRSLATENPNMSIRGLFSQQGRDQTSCASDLHVHDVMHGFAAGAAD